MENHHAKQSSRGSTEKERSSAPDAEEVSLNSDFIQTLQDRFFQVSSNVEKDLLEDEMVEDWINDMVDSSLAAAIVEESLSHQRPSTRSRGKD